VPRKNNFLQERVEGKIASMLKNECRVTISVESEVDRRD
jgi:hypothetical protein